VERNMPCYQMMGYPCSGSPIESLGSMYPEIYHRVYPKVRDMCMIMDTPANPGMYPAPNRAIVERMVDDIYRRTVAEIGDPDGHFREGDERQFTAFSGRGLLRDLIFILLIRELFRRRGRVY
jgi:hypothetical protein